jgi:hypothetical protein
MGIGRVRMALSGNYPKTPFVGSVSTYIVVFCATIKTTTALNSKHIFATSLGSYLCYTPAQPETRLTRERESDLALVRQVFDERFDMTVRPALDSWQPRVTCGPSNVRRSA